MEKSEEKTGKEKYKLWWILDYFFEEDKTDKSGKSTGWKAFSIGANSSANRTNSICRLSSS